MCMYMCLRGGLWIPVSLTFVCVCEGQRTTTDIFGCHLPFVGDKVFHWPGPLPCWSGWLGLPVSAFLIISAGTTGTHTFMPVFLCDFWRTEFRSLGLQGSEPSRKLHGSLTKDTFN